MDVLIILVLISLGLLGLALLFLFKGIKEGDYEHADRLSLLPLEQETGRDRGHDVNRGGGTAG